MYTRPQNFIYSLRVYPRAVKKEEKNKAGGYLLDVCVDLPPGAKEIYKDTKIVLQVRGSGGRRVRKHTDVDGNYQLFRGGISETRNG